MIRPISMANGRRHFFPPVQSKWALNYLLYSKQDSVWTQIPCVWEPTLNSGAKALMAMRALREGGPGRTALINKCFMEEIRIEHDLNNWPRAQSSMQSWLFFYKCNRIPAYTPICKAMLWNIQRLKNYRRFASLKAILENLFFKCNYLRMRRVLHDELKSTKLALQWNA